MHSIEVFSTNLVSMNAAMELKQLLRSVDNDFNIHFDLEDCDRIMRIKGANVPNEKIIELAATVDVCCKVLPD